MNRIYKRTALITGGASGIGLAISRLFAEEGAFVHILDADAANAEREADLIIAAGGSAQWHQVDVSNQAQVKKVVERIAKAQTIDILVNNAGVAHIGTAENTPEEDFDRLMSINAKGVYNMLHECLPFMKTTGGSIVNICSVAATLGISERFAYSATKGAVLSMTLSVAKDFISYGIRSNCISPGRIHTPFVDGFLAKYYPDNQAEMFEKLSKTQPIGRMGKPSEIASLVLFLASDDSSFITGTNYAIDGGYTTLNS